LNRNSIFVIHTYFYTFLLEELVTFLFMKKSILIHNDLENRKKKIGKITQNKDKETIKNSNFGAKHKLKILYRKKHDNTVIP